MSSHAMKRERRLEWLAGAGLMVLSLGFHLCYFRHGANNLVDLGVACVDAERILQGQIPGRDFFEPYGPGRFYLTALAFKAFGTSLLTFSGLCLVLLSVKDLLVYLAARHLMSRPWALYAACLSVLVHGPIHKVFLMLAGMLVLYPAFRLLAQPDKRTAFWWAFWIVIAGLIRYDVGAMGLFLAIPLLLLLARGAKGLINGFLGGLLVTAGPVIVLHGIFTNPGLLLQHHWIRLQSLEAAGSNMPGLAALLRSPEGAEAGFGIILLFFGLVLLLTGLLAAYRGLAHPGNARQALYLVVLLLLALLLFNQVRLGLKFSRFSQVAAPLFMALALLLQTSQKFTWKVLFRRWTKPLFALLASAFICMLGLYLWQYQGTSSQDAFSVLKRSNFMLSHPRSGCSFKGVKGQAIKDVLDYLEQSIPREEALFAGPTCPLFYFLTARPNPTPFTDFSFYNLNDAGQHQVIESIEKAGVRHVILWRRPLTGFHFDQSTPILANYLQGNFALSRRIGRFEILETRW